MRFTSDVLADPVPPMTPMVSPLLMCRSISARARCSAFSEYLKVTLSKSMEPSRISVSGWAGFLMVGSVRSTSQMRSALSWAIVIMAKTIETIMRAMRIMKP